MVVVVRHYYSPMTNKLQKTSAGFTLIELLAVMAIIAILSTVGIVGYRKFQIAADENATRAKMEQYAALADSYEHEYGDFPLDTFADLGARTTNDTNTGIEAFIANLTKVNNKYSGDGPNERDLVNTDDDKFTKKVTKSATQDAFEVADIWKNPIVYISRKSYGKKQTVLAKRRGAADYEETTVQAVTNMKTKSFQGPNSFQFISAGYDGEFGTSDDIVVTGNK